MADVTKASFLMNQYVLALFICAQTVSIKILISDTGQATTKTLFLEKAETFFLSFRFCPILL